MTTAAVSSSDVLAPAHPTPERTLYTASGLRKTMICFIFLLLLPFFGSLAPMIGMRLKHGLVIDALGLGVLAIAFTALMFWLLIILMFSLRARVQLGEKDVRLTLPSGRGATPMLRYQTHELHYADIAAVETRKELYGGAIAPVMMEGARIVKKDGTIIKLGYDAQSNTDQAFPYIEIAHAIAKRAGLQVTDHGHVRRSKRLKMMGIMTPADAAPVGDAEIAKLNADHNRFIAGLVVAMLALVAAGLTLDLLKPPSTQSAVADGVQKPKKK
ncbi:MAG: hypothetical protein ABL901_06600 [Hyphomicrobiaceae bacterium]